MIRDILLHGKFIPLHPENSFSSITAENSDKQITVLYSDIPFTYKNKDADVFHNGDITGIVFENPEKKQLQVGIYNCFGEMTDKISVSPETITRINVPVKGMFCVRE